MMRIVLLLWWAISITLVECGNSVINTGSSIKFTPLIAPSGYKWFQRVDRKENIAHLELYKKMWPSLLLQIFPKKVLPPVAKTGLRTYSAKGSSMNSAITDIYGDDELNGGDSVDFSVGVFVYMWVAPKLRGKGLGDIMLTAAQEACRRKGDSHMLIVHDDNGSGNLIRYYEERGFRIVGDFIDKGMICRL